MQKQIHVFYYGKVQGVGFRFTAEGLASELGITGWVKNLQDARVEIVAEAGEAGLKEFLRRIAEAFSQYITNTQLEWSPATGEFKDFAIHF